MSRIYLGRLHDGWPSVQVISPDGVHPLLGASSASCFGWGASTGSVLLARALLRDALTEEPSPELVAVFTADVVETLAPAGFHLDERWIRGWLADTGRRVWSSDELVQQLGRMSDDEAADEVLAQLMDRCWGEAGVRH